MSNDSTRNKKRTPARSRADAPGNHNQSLETGLVTGDFIPADSTSRALTPEVGRVDDRQFVRENGLEMTYSGDRGFVRDVDLARSVIGLAKPRNIRERIKAMLANGDIRQDQVIALIDDDAIVYYVDRQAATTLAFRSSKTDPEEIARRMFGVQSAFDSASGLVAPMPLEKAISGYQRTISFLIKKDAPRAGKLAMVPVLEKYARAAGLPMPDVSELIGPDQPRLEGM